MDIRRVAVRINPCICYDDISCYIGLGHGFSFPLACLWGCASATDARCGSPLAGCHLGAPHNGLGSSTLSPYRLVGGEWALTCASSYDEPSLGIHPCCNLARPINSSPEGTNFHDRDRGAHCSVGCDVVCHVCGKYELGHCPHAVARLGAIQSLIVLGIDVCEGVCVETSVAFGSDSVKQYIVSAPPSPMY